jgi:hypothetical protein
VKAIAYRLEDTLKKVRTDPEFVKAMSNVNPPIM